MRIMVSNILWDLDEDDPKCDLNLPDGVIIENSPEEMLKITDDDYADMISDFLTDSYGFCVKGFRSEMVKENEIPE